MGLRRGSRRSLALWTPRLPRSSPAPGLPRTGNAVEPGRPRNRGCPGTGARRQAENERGAGCVGTVMQTWEAITSRRNVRSFADRPVSAADLDQILEAGRRSPSSQNWQPWDFILVTERGQLLELAK